MMYVERQRGVCDVFLGTEHRLKNEELEVKFNKQDKKKSTCPADAARIAKEGTRQEERSGRLRIASAGWLRKRKELRSLLCNEGRIARAWVPTGGVIRVFAVMIFGSLLSLPLVASPSHFLFSVLSPWSLSSSTPAPFSPSFPFLHPVKLCPSLTLVG